MVYGVWSKKVQAGREMAWKRQGKRQRQRLNKNFEYYYILFILQRLFCGFLVFVLGVLCLTYTLMLMLRNIISLATYLPMNLHTPWVKMHFNVSLRNTNFKQRTWTIKFTKTLDFSHSISVQFNKYIYNIKRKGIAQTFHFKERTKKKEREGRMPSSPS